MKTLKQIAESSVLTEDQLKKIEKLILDDQFYPETTVREEMDAFCTGLGMSDFYFRTTPVETIACHIEALRAAEILATLRREKVVKVDFETEHENDALYLVEEDQASGVKIEERIEDKYPHYRLQSYRTLRKARGLQHLRMYVVYRPQYGTDKVLPDDTDMKKISDRTFLNTVPKDTLDRYKSLLERAKGWESPLIDVTPVPKDKELRISVVTKTDASPRFFSNVSDVINSHGLFSKRKYIEHFANGRTIYTFYLDEIKSKDKLRNLIEDISLIYVIPESPLSVLFQEGKLTAQEFVFANSAWSFAHQFLSGYNEEYLKLADALKDSPELLGILRDLKIKLAKETYTESRCWEAFVSNYTYIKKLFVLFDRKFNPAIKNPEINNELAALKKDIVRHIPTEADRSVFLAVCLFIDVILKTNFYIKEKVSISYMYRPDFLNKVDYPIKPFGLFHVIGREFRGFHIRFRDIARGGIRIVRSSNLQTYLTNSDFIFDENYNLASTQQRKNKDLPDGGSKGTVLLRWGFQDRPEAAFKKYIDGLLDLMLPDPNVVDYYCKDIILFLGPDEGTADLMEWAAFRAKARGYRFWKAFTTGKPVTMGGIPHDLYGMTTSSVHEYVVRSLAKLGLKEEKMTKVMTGGPDGDLGSNEILISKDRILAVVDGSGVLYDPEGLNRKELTRLAKARKMVEHFNVKLLAPEGFLVSVKDADIVLPDGEKVENGLEFRNTFHLHPKFKADIFVPCGGRPSSITINNWTTWINEAGEPRFKIIAEGANLFITQQARLRLEQKGVILYKDASANKGGVTSSHLEVLASLALTDEEWNDLMCVREGKISDFRKSYVQEDLEYVRDNAALEFEVIWREHERTGIPRSILSDMISEKINQIKDAINESDLIEDKELLKTTIECCIPPILVKKVGFAKILQRVPETYLKALFASRLAGRYVYRFGLEANEIHFYHFLQEFKKARGKDL
jgi:glutamate dehydrogenase